MKIQQLSIFVENRGTPGPDYGSPGGGSNRYPCDFRGGYQRFWNPSADCE